MKSGVGVGVGVTFLIGAVSAATNNVGFAALCVACALLTAVDYYFEKVVLKDELR